MIESIEHMNGKLAEWQESKCSGKYECDKQSKQTHTQIHNHMTSLQVR